MGVTWAKWKEAQTAGWVPKDTSLAGASREQLALVLRMGVWEVYACPEVASGPDLMVFDIGMMSGPKGTARVIQRAVVACGGSLVLDSQWGPKTKAELVRVAGAQPKVLVGALQGQAKTYYKSLPGAAAWLAGWLRRRDDSAGVALTLVEK